MRSLGKLTVLAVAAALAATVAGCTSTPEDDSATIALLLPESQTSRYENQDRPNFTAAVEEACASCEVVVSNAQGDASAQLEDAEAAITRGASVLVVSPVDSSTASAIVERAAAAEIPVISYIRPILDSEVAYYVSTNNEEVGRLQGQALVDALADRGVTSGNLVMMNGAATDANAGIFKDGAHSVIDGSSFTVGAEYDTPDWSSSNAQSQMDQAITLLGADTIVGVYSANDGMYAGAMAAMIAAGMDPSEVVSTGLDADVTALQRILQGTQTMTVYNDAKSQAQIAAKIAVALATGEEVDSSIITGVTNNGMLDVPTALVQPVAVTIDNIGDTVIADGYWSIDDVCTDEYADACAAAGLTN